MGKSAESEPCSIHFRHDFFFSAREKNDGVDGKGKQKVNLGKLKVRKGRDGGRIKCRSREGLVLLCGRLSIVLCFLWLAADREFVCGLAGMFV